MQIPHDENVDWFAERLRGWRYPLSRSVLGDALEAATQGKWDGDRIRLWEHGRAGLPLTVDKAKALVTALDSAHSSNVTASGGALVVAARPSAEDVLLAAEWERVRRAGSLPFVLGLLQDRGVAPDQDTACELSKLRAFALAIQRTCEALDAD